MSDVAHDSGATADACAGLADEPPQVYVESDGPRLRITMYTKAHAGRMALAGLGILTVALGMMASSSVEWPGNTDAWANWVIGAGAVLALAANALQILWAMGGQEVLTLDDQAFRIQRGLGDLGWTRSYRRGDILELRLHRSAIGLWALTPPDKFWRGYDVRDSLALVLPGRTIPFAMGLPPEKLEAVRQVLVSHPNWSQVRDAVGAP